MKGSYLPPQRILLKDYLTIGCGSRALVCYPENERELKNCLLSCREENKKYYLLANGSNVLPGEETYDGVLISVKRLKGYSFSDGFLNAYAGESFSSLNNVCRSRGVLFAPFMAGVPALVGGGVAMNAGVSSYHLNDIIDTVTATDGQRDYILSNTDCKFGLKDSVFLRERLAIVKVRFSVTACEREKIEEAFRYFLKRRAHLPKGKSMGCVFKNNLDEPSGALIDRCGLKGARVGGAYVSTEHANFIINDGTATVNDVRSLISFIKETVRRKTGKNLSEEIRYIV